MGDGVRLAQGIDKERAWDFLLGQEIKTTLSDESTSFDIYQPRVRGRMFELTPLEGTKLPQSIRTYSEGSE